MNIPRASIPQWVPIDPGHKPIGRRGNLGALPPALLMLLGLLIASGQPAIAAERSEDAGFDTESFAAVAEQLRQDTGAPGMAVAVLEGGQTLHIRGYGIAGPDGQLVTARTAFQIGSITKSMVAVVILQLAAEGKLGLDDPVVAHLPTFRTAHRAKSDRITIDHLLTHHSGLTTLHGNSINTTGSGLTGPAAAVASLASVQLFADPGTTFQYSNANYVLLSHLIELLDGQPFEQALKTRLFDRLGMTSSFVHVAPSADIAVATGYRLWFGVPRPWQPKAEASADRSMIGAGGVWASIEDMARYLEAVRSRDPRVIPDDADRLFAIKFFYEQWGYAYGWYASSGGSTTVFEHSGFTPGFLTLATFLPEDGKGVVVLTNLSGLGQGDLPRAVTHAAFGWEPVAAAPQLGARLAIWSAAAAPLGLLLALYRTAERLFRRHQPMRAWVRVVNALGAAALVAGIYAIYIGFQSLTAVSFPAGFAFFPDLTATTVAALSLMLILAAGRLALAIRGR
ncbi:MAG: serine hydrolase domain-containing protein [Pseudomonadota bacterium]